MGDLVAHGRAVPSQTVTTARHSQWGAGAHKPPQLCLSCCTPTLWEILLETSTWCGFQWGNSPSGVVRHLGTCLVVIIGVATANVVGRGQ